MDSRKDYEAQLRERLAHWDARIEELRRKAQSAPAGERQGYERRLESVRTRRRLAQEAFHKLQDSSSDTWNDLKRGVEIAWGELGKALDDTKY